MTGTSSSWPAVESLTNPTVGIGATPCREGLLTTVAAGMSEHTETETTEALKHTPLLKAYYILFRVPIPSQPGRWDNIQIKPFSFLPRLIKKGSERTNPERSLSHPCRVRTFACEISG